jgi:hypothetical protein
MPRNYTPTENYNDDYYPPDNYVQAEAYIITDPVNVHKHDVDYDGGSTLDSYRPLAKKFQCAQDGHHCNDNYDYHDHCDHVHPEPVKVLASDVIIESCGRHEHQKSLQDAIGHANGIATLDRQRRIPLENLGNAVGAKKVPYYEDMLNLTVADLPVDGFAYVSDASADPTVQEGWALYYRLRDSLSPIAWKKITDRTTSKIKPDALQLKLSGPKGELVSYTNESGKTYHVRIDDEISNSKSGVASTKAVAEELDSIKAVVVEKVDNTVADASDGYLVGSVTLSGYDPATNALTFTKTDISINGKETKQYPITIKNTDKNIKFDIVGNTVNVGILGRVVVSGSANFVVPSYPVPTDLHVDANYTGILNTSAAKNVTIHNHVTKTISIY